MPCDCSYELQKKRNKFNHLSLKEKHSVTIGVVMKEQFEMSLKVGRSQAGCG